MRERARVLIHDKYPSLRDAKSEQVEPVLVEATQLDPENVLRWTDLSIVRANRKPADIGGAIDALRVSLDLSPVDDGNWRFLASLYAKQGQRDLAMAAWDSAIAVSARKRQNDEVTRNYVERVLIEEYNKYRKDNGLPTITANEAKTKAASWKWDPVGAAGRQIRAKEIYDGIHGRRPEVNGHVFSYDSPQDFADVESRLVKAIELDPTKGEYWIELADFRIGSARLAGSVYAGLPEYSRAISLDARRQNCWLNLGDAQRISKDYPAATESYHRALALPPESPTVSKTSYLYEGLVQCFTALNQKDNAVAAYEDDAISYQPSAYGLDAYNKYRTSNGLKAVTIDEVKAAKTARATKSSLAFAQAVALEKAG